MSLVWVIVGSILQVFLAFFLFMLVVFSAGGIVNGVALSRLQLGIFNLSMFVLPGLSLISALMVVYGYHAGWSTRTFWWYALPVVAATGYLFYAMSFNQP